MRKYIIVFLLLAFVACGIPHYLDETNIYIPKKSKFTLKQSLMDYNGKYLVDTNAIYEGIFTNIYIGPIHYDTVYEYKRFFSKGQYFASNYFTYKPTKKDYDSLVNGTIGYYTFINNEVLVETFSITQGGAYFYSKFKVNDGSINKYKEKVRCFNCGWSRINLTYYKIQIKNLKSNTFW